jgi:hypothetical protein
LDTPFISDTIPLAEGILGKVDELLVEPGTAGASPERKPSLPVPPVPAIHCRAPRSSPPSKMVVD